jgi:PAS domain S-box-containing protein
VPEGRQDRPDSGEAEKKTTLSSRESELRYRRLFETAQDGILIIDFDSERIIDANPFLTQLLGYPHDELIGKTLWETGPFSNVVRSKIAFDELKTKGSIRYEDLPLETRDGGQCKVEFVSNVYALDGAKVIQCNIRDTTERTQAEEAMRRQADLLQKTFDSMIAAVFILDAGLPTLTVVECNQAACAVFGYDREEMLGKTTEFLHVSDETLREFRALLYSAVEEGRLPFHLTEFHMKRKNGTIFPSEHTVSQLMNTKGERTAWVSIVRDITERKRMEEALRESEERHRLLFEKSPVGIGLASLDGKVLAANETMQAITGYSLEELKRIALADTYENSADRKKLLESLDQAGSVADYPARLRRKDGTPYDALLTISRVHIADKGFLQTTCVDITERKSMEKEIRSLAEFPSENPNPVLRLDREGTVLAANEASKLLIQEWRSGIRQVAPKFWRDLVADALSTGQSRNVDIEFGGKSYTFLVKPIVEAAYVNLYGRDMTDRKRAEEALRDANQFNRAVISGAREGIIVYDFDLNYRVWNRFMEELTGMPAEKVLGKNALESFPHLRQQGVDVLLKKALLGETVASPNTPFQIPETGKSGWVSGVYGPLHDVQGKIVGVIGLVRDVAEHMRMEEELRRYSTQLEQLVAERTRELAASKDFAENLIQTANAIVVGLDNHGSVRFLNQAAERITGYTSRELEGRNWFEVIAPKDRYPEVWTEFERLTAGGLPKNFENPILTKSGEEHYIVWQNSEVREQGQAVGIISFGIDITERKRAEEELRATRERLEYVIGSNPAVIFTGRPRADYSDYDATYMSSTVSQMIGFQPKELIGNPRFWESRVHPDDLPRYHAELPQFWKEGHHVFEYRFLHKDGTYRWLREEARLIHDASGKPVEVIGYGADITERRRMEEELRAARERLEYMITSNPAVIYGGKPLADHSDFVLTYISDRVVEMLGFEPREFIGDPELWQRRVHPEDVRSVLTEVPRLWKEGRRTFEYRFLHRDGTYRWIREEAKVVRDADGKPIEVNGYWTDITERKHLEEALAKSQRLAAIGETSAMVGHDLRNPLQGIAGVVYLAKRNLESRRTTDRKSVTELLNTIQEQITYMDKIVSDLQDYAQPLLPKLTETDLSSLIRQTLSTIKVPTAVRVSVEVEKAAQNVMIDPTLTRRTFANLAINAIQAMPKRGKLTIRARRKGNSTVITVEDTGEGIPKKNLTKLFSPFFTTKAKGQGLGLAVCKRLVEAQGGTITVKSKPRKGTAFTIKLPRGKKEVAS